MLSLLLISVIVILVYIIYTINRKTYNFWKELNVPFIKPLPFVGNIAPILLFQKHIGKFFGDIYRDNCDKPYVGIYVGNKPCLVINDYSIIETILNKDFQYFSKRMFSPPEEIDPLTSKSLFGLHGYNWKAARSKLTPGFTTLKLKKMCAEMVTISEKLSTTIKQADRFHAMDISVRYTIDTINCTVFGLDGKAIEDPKNDGLRNIYTLMTSGIVQAYRNVISFTCPQVMYALRIRFFNEEVNKFMLLMADKIIKDRTSTDIKRNDFMDMLMEQRSNGGWQMENGKVFELDGENFAAQIFIFITAGFETSASCLSFTLYELARNQEIQEKARREINDAINNHGSLSYESLNEMKYLDMIVNETLRLHPPFPFLDKACTKDYKLPGSDVIIPSDTYIMIPMMGLQHDGKFWAEPENYDPERFRDPGKNTGKPFLPFGQGMRMCLGNVFALMQIKMGVIAAIKDCVLTTERTSVIVNPKKFNLTPTEDILIYASPIPT